MAWQEDRFGSLGSRLGAERGLALLPAVPPAQKKKKKKSEAVHRSELPQFMNIAPASLFFSVFSRSDLAFSALTVARLLARSQSVADSGVRVMEGPVLGRARATSVAVRRLPLSRLSGGRRASRGLPAALNP